MKTFSTYAVDRERILSSLDTAISAIILEADRIERFDIAVPGSVLNEAARRLVAVAFMLSVLNILNNLALSRYSGQSIK